MSLVDSSYYGVVGATQPSGGPEPQQNPGNTAPVATQPRAGQTGFLSNPVFWLVIIVAGALGLIHLSIRWS